MRTRSRDLQRVTPMLYTGISRSMRIVFLHDVVERRVVETGRGEGMPGLQPTGKHLLRPIICAGIALLCLSAPSAGQERGQPDLLAPLKTCQAESDAMVRLACYDAAVKDIVAASDQGELRVIDAEAVRKTRRGLFGFSLPDLGIFGGDDGEKDELDRLETTVSSVRYLTPNSFVFRIAEGDALWQVSDAPRRLLRVESGDPVVIEKAALGSYFIRFDGQNGVKGRRVE